MSLVPVYLGLAYCPISKTNSSSTLPLPPVSAAIASAETLSLANTVSGCDCFNVTNHAQDLKVLFDLSPGPAEQFQLEHKGAHEWQR